jgi:hypothetical protein
MQVEFKPDPQFDDRLEAIIVDEVEGPICLGYIQQAPICFIPYEDVWFDADELIQIGMKIQEMEQTHS